VKTLIVPDIHGHYKTLESLLQEAGVIDTEGNRLDGWHVVQLGDLANCVRESVNDDLDCLKTVGTWIDEMLVGNHEYGYFDGGFGFGGFCHHPEIQVELNRIERQGLLSPSALVGKDLDILVTHAGYVPSEGIESASRGHEYAHLKWYQDYRHPLFSRVGWKRGGPDNSGGILWSDWMEQKAHEFNQVVGHTPQKKGVQRRDYEKTGKWTICIDLGAKSGKGATGLILDEDDNIEYVSTSMSGNHW